ncbi:hypothetical protein [Planctomicrobium sp. SH527]|uniref:hypothetical protein n=1 Tax=Planctomicrobium sp. SH527 TaxID=3448123 RepID=UPI003F5CA061
MSAAVTVLDEIAQATDDGSNQKLHGATFETEERERIQELLDEIGVGLAVDEATNRQKLNIARTYGCLLVELKTLVPHGAFKSELSKRFPTINYAKCNRWMYLAKNEQEVASALEEYPDVAWGPKKMIDYLRGTWLPEEEGEDDEEDCVGLVLDDQFKNHNHMQTSQLSDESPSNQPRANQSIPLTDSADRSVTSQSKKANSSKKDSDWQEPDHDAALVDYEVEVRLGFKLSIPETMTVEELLKVIRKGKEWKIDFPSFDGSRISETGVVVNHVKPWGDLTEIEPEMVSDDEVDE